MKTLASTLLSLLCAQALALSAPARAASDDNPNPNVYPLTEKVGEKTYAEWAAAWWQWGLGIKKDKNPITDQTGKFAGEGQSGPVWFLAGNFGGETKRTCSIPAGKALFFPVVNQGPGTSAERADEKVLSATAKELMDTAEDLQVIVDEKPLKDVVKYRVATPLFTLNGPDKADAVVDNASGACKMVSDGYWIMLKPLDKGDHTLRIKGTVKKARFSLDVTYKLTVVDDKEK
jgi:hypothetical protein